MCNVIIGHPCAHVLAKHRRDAGAVWGSTYFVSKQVCFARRSALSPRYRPDGRRRVCHTSMAKRRGRSAECHWCHTKLIDRHRGQQAQPHERGTRNVVPQSGRYNPTLTDYLCKKHRCVLLNFAACKYCNTRPGLQCVCGVCVTCALCARVCLSAAPRLESSVAARFES